MVGHSLQLRTLKLFSKEMKIETYLETIFDRNVVYVTRSLVAKGEKEVPTYVRYFKYWWINLRLVDAVKEDLIIILKIWLSWLTCTKKCCYKGRVSLNDAILLLGSLDTIYIWIWHINVINSLHPSTLSNQEYMQLLQAAEFGINLPSPMSNVCISY